ncbi:hypothetical protein ACFXHA_06970 [Nocardia sp. NPDC059240]|uniref:hypothetical protein n=1 Tax=Nocardia sp. NPDC059240 TaxID=3346786 RepID=UPI0036B679C3
MPDRPEPARTSETVTPGFVLCYECDGVGRCPRCDGAGWLTDDTGEKRKCPVCHAHRVCLICRGDGQLAISRLSRYQRGYYPQLRAPD